jgi:hypothetical protein
MAAGFGSAPVEKKPPTNVSITVPIIIYSMLWPQAAYMVDMLLHAVGLILNGGGITRETPL